MPEISVNDLKFHYTEGVPVLRGITIDFSPGAIAIVGQNGAGKSTFVRLLNGLLKPKSGSVTVNSVETTDVTVATLSRTVGLVFQNPADQLFKSRVTDEVMFGPQNLGYTPEEAQERARHALERLGLGGVAHENPYDLGLAERKLVTVAGILAMGTEVVILDEPTIAQDVEGTRRLGNVVEDLTAEGKMVISITHDMDFVTRYFGRVVVMQQGVVHADGSASEVFAAHDILEKAGLEPPQITRLGQALGLDQTILTSEEFVKTYQEKGR